MMDDSEYEFEYEDWSDDEDEDYAERTVDCPECGGEMNLVVEQCPHCGYWLTEADLRLIEGPKYRSEGLNTVALVVAGLFVGVLLLVAAATLLF